METGKSGSEGGRRKTALLILKSKVLTDRNSLQAEETAMASGSTAMEAMEEAGAQYDLHIIFRNAYHGMER